MLRNGGVMNKIKEVIQEKGLKLNYIAERLDCFNTHISMWIKEERYPTQKQLLKMARILKTSVRSLYPNAIRKTYWEIKEGE
tara:strand:- start:1331 stop:1576 length:246 start_codon:yes stop_codon:yes gene_type:complete